MTGIKQLPPEKLCTYCDPDLFSFETTAEIEPLSDVVGQERAVEAVRFAIGMRHPGYNLFVLGPEGTGRTSLVRRFLEGEAAKQPTPDDFCYVHNFTDHRRPCALTLPPGHGRALRDDMRQLVDDLMSAIPTAFESEEFRNRKNAVEEEFNEKREGLFSSFQDRARERGIVLIRSPSRLALAHVVDDKVLSTDDFEALAEKEQTRRKMAIEELQDELEEIVAGLPGLAKEEREKIKALTRDETTNAVGHQIDELKKQWNGQPAVGIYLEAVRADLIEHAGVFMPQEMAMPQMMQLSMGLPRPMDSDGMNELLRRYQVNVIVDNRRSSDDKLLKGAPVIDEDHPTQPNLIGRIEYQSQFGNLITNFTLIKGGALHRANGGYLVLDARKLLMQPYAWETLLRALHSRRVRIESLGEALGFTSTQTLDPEPANLDLKVILIGEAWLYYLLSYHDPTFRELFKVAADFDPRMDRNDEAVQQYARLIATLATGENLKPLSRSGMGRIIEHAARIVDDAEKLSTHMQRIVDIVRESDYWADQDGAKVITFDHVQKAIDARIYRHDRIRESVQEAIRRGTLVIETDGAKVGQINGLSVIQLDHFSFGRPSRISCSVRMGKGEVIDIEREVALGGPLHSKGVLILSSFLGYRFGQRQPLSLSASLVFEQSYGGIEGDSASSGELYALLSALSGIPIKQSLAVTGSVDQHGRVQAIGGVNDKIEGFFDTCATRGLTGDQGVLIPAANIKHLMLRSDVVEAARNGQFHIYPVENIDEGITLLTGLPAGTADEKGEYPIGTVNRAVARGIGTLAKRFREAIKPEKNHRRITLRSSSDREE